MQVAEGEPLPRGRSSREGSKVDQPVGQDPEPPLFGARASRKKKHTTATKATKRVKVDSAAEDSSLRERKTVSTLIYSQLSQGVRLLGCVKEVFEDKIVLSFANNITAAITWDEVSDEHHQAFEGGLPPPSNVKSLFPLHRFVLCMVTAVGERATGTKYVKVTCRASLVNKASRVDVDFASKNSFVVGTVKSLEDHGAVINIGSKDIQGFLPYGRGSGSGAFSVGQQVFTVVKSRSSKGVAQLQAATPSTVSQCNTFNLLQPGILVRMKLRRQDLFDGGVLLDWEGFMVKCDWQHHQGLHEEESDVQARLLWLDPHSRSLGVSLTHEMRALSVSYDPALMDKVVDCSVVSYRGGYGMCLAIPQRAFVYVNRIKDSSEKVTLSDMKTTFPVGEQTKGRVLDFSPIDNLYIVSLQTSLINASVTTYASIVPGMKIMGKVVKIDPSYGILIEVGNKIRAIVGLVHLSDSASSESAPETRFAIGQVCNGRVLSVKDGKISVTLKKSLVKTSLPILKSYQEAQVNLVVSGYVSKVETFGLIVHFFGGVHGLVPAHTLGSQAAESPGDFFQVSFPSSSMDAPQVRFQPSNPEVESVT